MTRATVYVVDDDPSIVFMLEELVSTLGVDVRSFSSASNFLSSYQPNPKECLLCDLRMPVMDGVQLQVQLLNLGYRIPIIFLTGFAEVSVAVEAMKLGAFDFIQKPFSARALLEKIQLALADSLLRYELWDKSKARAARVALLTPKEMAIAQLVVDAKSSPEISTVLSISVRTVENHRTRIMEKLHVSSTVELVKLFV